MDIDKKALKWIAYCRKSTEQEDKQILSIDAQKREIKEMTDKSGAEMVDLLWESRTAYKTGRVEFAKVLERIESGEVNGIIAYHLSRLARNTADGGRLIYLMDEGKLKAIWTPTKIYADNSDDKFFLQIEFGMSKKSSDDTSTYVKRDIQSKLLKGEYPAMVPIGYINIDKDSKIAGKKFDSKKQLMLEALGRPLKRIELDPVNAPLMSQLFKEAHRGDKNLRDLCKFANNLGIYTKRFHSKFGKSQMHRILTSRFYCGMIEHGGELYQGVHEPIISQKEFDDIQVILRDRSRPRPHHLAFVYRGFIKCGICNLSVLGVTKVKPNGKSYTYYMCSKRHGNCGQPGIPEGDLDKQIEERIAAVSVSERLWKVSLKLLKESYGAQMEKQVDKRKQWENEHRIVEMKIKKLLDLRIEGVVGDDEYKAKRTELFEEKQKLEELINGANADSNNWITRAEQFFNYALAICNTFKYGNPEAKRKVMGDIGWNLLLKDKVLAWEYKKPFTFLLDQPVIEELAPVSVGTQKIGELNEYPQLIAGGFVLLATRALAI